MGCFHSKEKKKEGDIALKTPAKDPEAVPVATEDTSKDQDKGKEPEKEKPKPQVFAIMRNGHEVLRGLSVDITALFADDTTTCADVAAVWNKFIRWMQLHALMEDGASDKGKGFFAVLDERFEKVATEQGLVQAHIDIAELETAMDDSLKGDDIAAVKTAWEAFTAANEAHLLKEEEHFMPKVQAMAKAKVNLVEVLRTDVLSCAWNEDDFGDAFLTVAGQTLEKHAGGKPRPRVFFHALQKVASNEQWDAWLPFIKKGLSSQLYDAIGAEIGWEKPSA